VLQSLLTKILVDIALLLLRCSSCSLRSQCTKTHPKDCSGCRLTLISGFLRHLMLRLMYIHRKSSQLRSVRRAWQSLLRAYSSDQSSSWSLRLLPLKESNGSIFLSSSVPAPSCLPWCISSFPRYDTSINECADPC
jgi:hypothetical protein